MNIRHTITFTGRVQGVGFRATTRSVAQGFAVAGFVSNQRDGSVLCVVEGRREELERFTRTVQQTMADYIRGAHMAESAATGEFDGFGIRH